MSNELNAVAPVAPVAPAATLREKLLALKAAETAAQASKPTTNAKPTGAAVVVGRMLDAFGSSPQVGTGRMHAVLAEAYAEGETLRPQQIAELIEFSRPVPGHLNTMMGRGRAVSDGRGNWRLTDAAGERWHGAGKTFGFAARERAEQLAKIEAEKKAAEAEAYAVSVPMPAEELASIAEYHAKLAAEEQPAEVKGKGKKGK